MNAVAKEHWPHDVADACRCPLATEATDPVSFLLIEDHPFFIDGLSGAIKQLFPSVDLICATSAREGMSYLETKTYDLVFLDLNLPDQNGFELLDALHLSARIQPVVILTGVVTFSIAEQARKKGAVGAISKSLTMDQLQSYCLKLLNGDTVYVPDALQQVEAQGELPTGRELEVLTTLDEGLENAEICSRLSVSDSTLRTHLRNLFAKLKVSNRTACLVQAKKLGWL